MAGNVHNVHIPANANTSRGLRVNIGRNPTFTNVHHVHAAVREAKLGGPWGYR
jgi:hypothetical protein